MVQLTPHFSLAEMTVTNSGLDNTPDQDQIAALTALCQNILEPLRQHFGAPVIVTSGFRSPAVNSHFGGEPDSQHLFGQAADIHIQGIANADIWRQIDSEMTFDQVIAEELQETDGAAGWIHVSFRVDRARGSAISYMGPHAATKYLEGLHFVG